MYKIENEKLLVEYEEMELIGGDPMIYIDESNGVSITCCPLNGLSLKFFARIKQNDKYYCRVVKKVKIPQDHIRQYLFNKLTKRDESHEERMDHFNLICGLIGL